MALQGHPRIRLWTGISSQYCRELHVVRFSNSVKQYSKGVASDYIGIGRARA